MANAGEILSCMKSIQDTRKITSAMYLISSTKLKKSKKLLEETELYFYSLQGLIRRVLRYMPDVGHFYFNPRKEIKEEDKVKELIVITGDKGLAGIYNRNVLKMAHEWIEQSKNHRPYVARELRRHYLRARYVQVEEQFHYTVQNPTMHRVCLISSIILEDCKGGRLDEVWIIYTQMTNSVQVETEMVGLPPLKREDPSNIITPVSVIQGEIQMVPSPGAVIDHVVPNYVVGLIFDALVGSLYSEQSARMMAMQSASDNTDAILNDLSTGYNCVRQAAITQETTEVIGGVKAQKEK